MKPERNAPCPCGSGKTFEKCCLEWYESAKPKVAWKKAAPTAVECDQLEALFNAGRLAELESQAHLLLEKYPESGFVWNLLGASLQMQGKDGLAALQNAAKFLPDDADVHSNLGNVLGDLGRLDEAEASYRRALQIDPHNANVLSNLGITLGDLGRLDEAEASYRRALQIKPGIAETHYNLGNTLKGLGRLNEAEASYRRALQIKPDFAQAHCNLGITLHELGRLDEAEASHRQALQINPDIAEAYDNLGSMLLKLGKLSEAESLCRRALDIKPDFFEAHISLGRILLKLGRLNEAEACYRQALEIKPDYAKEYNNFGNIHRYLGNTDQAISIFQKVLTIDPHGEGVNAAVSLTVLYYLNENIGQSRRMLDISQPINATSGFEQQNARAYWNYMGFLLSKKQEDNDKKHQEKGAGQLYVIGDSHCLSAHGALVSYRDREMKCSAELIVGCKQWHLGNNSQNRFKSQFQNIVETLPHASEILLLIGEIDCRHDEGVIKAWKKSPEMTMEDIARATVTSYISYVARVAAKFGHRVIVGGIPAVNIVRLHTLDTETADQLVKLIRLFNAILKENALVAGLDFLDVFALTDRGDGIANGEWHIDQFHLQPSAMIDAFGKYLVASEHSALQLD